MADNQEAAEVNSEVGKLLDKLSVTLVDDVAANLPGERSATNLLILLDSGKDDSDLHENSNIRKKDVKSGQFDGSAGNSSLEHHETLTASSKFRLSQSAKDVPQTNPCGTPLDINQLTAKLDGLLCHFTWKPEQNDPRYSNREAIKDVEEKVDNYEVGVANPVLDLCWLSVHGYVLALNGDYEKSLSVFEECLKALDDPALNNLREGFLHVLIGDQAHINFLLKNYEAAEKLLQDLKPFSELKPFEEAAVLAMAGHCCLEFGAMGFKKAISLFESALKLDPRHPDWNFLMGKVLGADRRIKEFRELPSNAEIEHLERAAANGRHPSYRLILAQSLVDKSFILFKLHGRDIMYKTERCKLNERAYKLFMDVLNENPRCAKTNVRCGKGFTTLSTPLKDLNLAEKCYLTALELAPDDNMVLHALGNFYQRQKNDLNKARECYEKCVAKPAGNYAAEMNLLRLNYFSDPKYDPVPDFRRALERYQDPGSQLKTYVQLGSYYYLRCGDLENAELCYSKAFQINPSSSTLKFSYPIFRSEGGVNTYKNLQEILLKLLAQTTDTDQRMAYSENLKSVEDFLANSE